MKTINVCIGSACHLKGSYDIINELQELIEKHNAEDVEVKAIFCLGHCTNAVSCRVDDGEVISLNMGNVKEFFEKDILNA